MKKNEKRAQHFGYKIENALLERIREEARKEDRSVSKMSIVLMREALEARDRDRSAQTQLEKARQAIGA